MTAAFMEFVCLFFQHCLSLQELQFSGPNSRVLSEDMKAVVSPNLQVLVMDQQMAFDNTVLEYIAAVSKLRMLSCAACYSVSDQGLHSLTGCGHLCELNISYCHLVSDAGITSVAGAGTLRRLIARACPNVTDKGLIELSKYCTQLLELDVSGCWQITVKSLYALQENLLHMRGGNNLGFSLTIGGTEIDGESAVQFATATSSSISLHNLSIASLQADYNTFLESVEEESLMPSPSVEKDFLMPSPSSGPKGLMEKAYDWLEADDPSMFSDEFSEPEEWAMGDVIN